MKNFVHLHLHSEYSLLDGAVSLDRLFEECERLGMPAVAITDHGNMFGAVAFYEKAVAYTEKKNNLNAENKDKEPDPVKFSAREDKFNIKPIFGCEFYVDADLRVKESAAGGRIPKFHHLVLLAKDYEGYENLVKLNSTAYVDGFFYKPRIDYKTLFRHTKGLVCLSACLAGGIPQALLRNDAAGAKALAVSLRDAFEPGDFYIELQDHNIAEQRQINPQLIRLAREIGVKVVATNDVHYIRRSDAEMQKVLQCISFRRTLSDNLGNSDGEDYFPTDEFYLKSREEMEAQFSYIQEALDNTLEIAEKCNLHLKFKMPLLPNYIPPDGKTPAALLREMAAAGLARKYKKITPEMKERAEYELSVIEKSGFVEYFLIVWDFINFAESRGIPVGPGRGSGVGSIVAYAIGITKVDPLKYGLIFERFLNSERVSMPDFDIDFDFERRGEVIEYVIGKYGEARVAQIVTFGTLASKAAIKDVGRVYSMPYGEVDRISKLIPFSASKVPLDKYVGVHKYEKGEEKKKREDEHLIIGELKQMYDNDQQVRRLLDMAMAIEGMPRQTSTHAAGVVICKDDISNYVPLQRNGEDITTQYDMIEVEKLGLLKMDFLGLRTLTDIRKAVEYVREIHGVDIDFYNMEYNDPKVYELIGSGDTHAVFQLESAGMKKFMMQLKPASLEDVIAGISLFRPGPMNSIPTYIANKKNPKGIKYDHPVLKPILEVTYGCIVYQEQVMQIVREMGGYSMGRADLVRRAMSKKKGKDMVKERQVFINGLEENGKIVVDGAVRRGVPEDVAAKVFGEMDSFAQYAFNKSHAAAYAYLAYQTAFLKCRYEVEYITAVLNNRISNIDELRNYLIYLKDHNIGICPPDINMSRAMFSVEGGKVRIGLAAVKNVGIKAIEAIIEERGKNGAYPTFDGFVKRMAEADAGLNKKLLESLILSGAFDCFGHTRSVLLAVYESMIDRAAKDRQARLKGQFSMFDAVPADNLTAKYPSLAEFPLNVKLKQERDVLGVYISGHPLDEYKPDGMNFNFDSSLIGGGAEAECEGGDGGAAIDASLSDEMSVRCGGILSDIRRHIVRNTGKEIGFARLEDLYGVTDLMFSGFKYEQYKNIISEDMPVIITGKLSLKEGEKPILRVDSLIRWEKKKTAAAAAPAAQMLCVQVSFKEKEQGKGGMEQFLSELQDILSGYTGANRVFIKNTDDGARSELPVKAAVSDALLNELYGFVGSEAVIVR